MTAATLWVYSPNLVVNEALIALLRSLGFAAQGSSDGAVAAVFDLTVYGAPLPPPPPTPCVAIVRSGEPDFLTEVQALGYRGVQRPSDGTDDLARTVAAIVAGDGDAATAAHTAAEPSADRPQLTQRETQVLGLLMLGLPNKRIASRLGITERTIKFHLSSLMRKYRTNGRLGLLLKGQGGAPS
jgi:DNA-binding CsgD family transcriptional regulator